MSSIKGTMLCKSPKEEKNWMNDKPWSSEVWKNKTKQKTADKLNHSGSSNADKICH